MITVVLVFLGVTLIYTGILVFDRDLTAALVSISAGCGFLAKPVMAAARYLRANYAGTLRSGKPKGKQRVSYIKLVEPSDKKPTIH